jgi:hypothetical protein
MKENRWARLLAYVTGLINQELLLKNEYLAAIRLEGVRRRPTPAHAGSAG